LGSSVHCVSWPGVCPLCIFYYTYTYTDILIFEYTRVICVCIRIYIFIDNIYKYT
jgi:hypothetical protein